MGFWAKGLLESVRNTVAEFDLLRKAGHVHLSLSERLRKPDLSERFTFHSRIKSDTC